MEQYAMPHDQDAGTRTDVATREARMAVPNMQGFAFTTIIWGAVFAGFIIRPFTAGLGLLAVTAFFGGLALFIGGMRQSALENAEHGTFFESYGVFLMALGALVAPIFGIPVLLGTHLAAAIGFLFLIWTIFTGIYTATIIRSNPIWVAALGLLFLASLCVMLGALIGAPTLAVIGGWLAIISGLVAWYGLFARLSDISPARFELPHGVLHREHLSE